MGVDFLPRSRRQIQTGDVWIGRVSATAEPSCPAKLKNTSSKFEHFSRWIGLGAKKERKELQAQQKRDFTSFHTIPQSGIKAPIHPLI